MALVPLETRMTNAVSKQLGATTEFHHWIEKPTGDVPVFAVPKTSISKAKNLGLTVVELVMNQHVLTFGSFLHESVGFADDGARIGEDHMADVIAAEKIKAAKKKEKDKWIRAFGEDDTSSLWPSRNGDQVREQEVSQPRYDVGTAMMVDHMWRMLHGKQIFKRRLKPPPMNLRMRQHKVPNNRFVHASMDYAINLNDFKCKKNCSTKGKTIGGMPSK